MLRLQDVHKSFGAVTAVNGLSLEVRQGELFGLLGPNGAGKSTTMNLAIGLLEPDHGTVTIGDHQKPTDTTSRRQIGVAPQTLALYDELTAEENLRFFGKLYGLRGRALKSAVDKLLDLVGLADRRRHRVGTYSGGMQRRLNLAVALVHDPPLLLLDEPTVGIDPQSRNAIFDFVQQLHDEGRTIVYTTHYMEEPQRLCERVAIIDHGRLLALDSVDALIAEHGGRSVITVERSTGDERIETNDPQAELLRLLKEGDAHGVRVDRPNLESVFLSLTGRSLRD